jgi:hypothetical protein
MVLLPLPLGEGWGEGLAISRVVFARYSYFSDENGTAPSDTKEFLERISKFVNKLTSYTKAIADGFQRLGPHPNPLPMGEGERDHC